ncbi:uncharacterized protein TNCV_2825291 [Trichonephila clavipes]|nr:uncharacterized protein TNCV_2825291 [Trichonephila clavipes]
MVLEYSMEQRCSFQSQWDSQHTELLHLHKGKSADSEWNSPTMSKGADSRRYSSLGHSSLKVSVSVDMPHVSLSADMLQTFIAQQLQQRGRRFAEWAQNEIAVVPDFHKRVLFSDEAHFWLNGYVNKQNCRIWSEANPQVYIETPLHPDKLTVWCALWAGGIIGPYFFKNDEGHNVTVNGDRYRAMITKFFIPELNNLVVVPTRRRNMSRSSCHNRFIERHGTVQAGGGYVMEWVACSWRGSGPLMRLDTTLADDSCQVIYSQFGLVIHQNDHQARRRFVECSQSEISVVPDFHKRILFSDEAHFWLNGYDNKQNCCIWSEANPQVYVETPLHPEKLTVWCALWPGGIIGPYFFKNDEGHNVTVNGDRYRAMITNFSFLN